MEMLAQNKEDNALTPKGTGRKRKDRTPPSTEGDRVKKQAEVELTDPEGKGEPSRIEDREIRTEAKKEKEPNLVDCQTFKRKEKQKKKKLRPRTGYLRCFPVRYSLVQRKMSYANVLRKVKADIPKQDVEDSIGKIRRTATGNGALVYLPLGTAGNHPLLLILAACCSAFLT